MSNPVLGHGFIVGDGSLCPSLFLVLQQYWGGGGKDGAPWPKLLESGLHIIKESSFRGGLLFGMGWGCQQPAQILVLLVSLV